MDRLSAHPVERLAEALTHKAPTNAAALIEAKPKRLEASFSIYYQLIKLIKQAAICLKALIIKISWNIQNLNSGN